MDHQILCLEVGSFIVFRLSLSLSLSLSLALSLSTALKSYLLNFIIKSEKGEMIGTEFSTHHDHAFKIKIGNSNIKKIGVPRFTFMAADPNMPLQHEHMTKKVIIFRLVTIILEVNALSPEIRKPKMVVRMRVPIIGGG